ncbi:hypothetical protein F9288_00445 [Sphingomonas sp. CL5.1]|uniref:hypothetical protein n=1 Tax=Sphingomonas sp. CL5.1 TaxID=2653203 RepID=UPI0015822C20|nr:hypothetical protein [Sphingomonas sp. CL5.1]QKR98290.1 hypothetical protein F9288_00445 [Sphingomonas sp. CL5.1]
MSPDMPWTGGKRFDFGEGLEKPAGCAEPLTHATFRAFGSAADIGGLLVRFRRKPASNRGPRCVRSEREPAAIKLARQAKIGLANIAFNFERFLYWEQKVAMT